MSFGVLGFVVTLALGIVVAPFAAEAQQTGKVYRIGMLETTSVARNAANLEGFRQGLREFGYVEGQNFVIDYRSVDGRQEGFPAPAVELVRLKADVILTRGTPAALAAKNASETIPVVMAGIGDPVWDGLVASLARPGGNVTGLTALTTELYPKRLELLRELVPKLVRVAALFNLGNTSAPPPWRQVETAARSLGVQPQLLDARKADDLGRAFETASMQRADAIIVSLDSLTSAHRQPIVELAAKHRLPAIYGSPEFMDAGGLMAYGVNYPHLYRRAARFVDKIFKGVKPADLPVEQPTIFELVINLKTAKALGLAVPQSLLLRADKVIQ